MYAWESTLDDMGGVAVTGDAGGGSRLGGGTGPPHCWAFVAPSETELTSTAVQKSARRK